MSKKKMEHASSIYISMKTIWILKLIKNIVLFEKLSFACYEKWDKRE